MSSGTLFSSCLTLTVLRCNDLVLYTHFSNVDRVRLACLSSPVLFDDSYLSIENVVRVKWHGCGPLAECMRK
jgi:hypothetical protein